MGILQKRNFFVASGDGQNCHRLWWAFNYQFKSCSVPTGHLIFQGTDSICNLYSVTTGWMFFQCLFSFGEGLRTMAQLF